MQTRYRRSRAGEVLMSNETVHVIPLANTEYSLTLPVHSNFLIVNWTNVVMWVSRVPDRVVNQAGVQIPGLAAFFSGIVVDTVDPLYFASPQPGGKFQVRGSLDNSPFARLYLYTDQGQVLTDDQGNPLIAG